MPPGRFNKPIKITQTVLAVAVLGLGSYSIYSYLGWANLDFIVPAIGCGLSVFAVRLYLIYFLMPILLAIGFLEPPRLVW